jgi:hypothetical protein
MLHFPCRTALHFEKALRGAALRFPAGIGM